MSWIVEGGRLVGLRCDWVGILMGFGFGWKNVKKDLLTWAYESEDCIFSVAGCFRV